MNLKEAIAEIEKRYKRGDVISCLTNRESQTMYTNFRDIEALDTSDDIVWMKNGNGLGIIIYNKKWAEPIREKKSLWGFFESVKDQYPYLAHDYLKECSDVPYMNTDTGGMLVCFHWNSSPQGYEYWDNINRLYLAYFKED